MPSLGLLFALQGMYRALNPPVRKQPEVRHAVCADLDASRSASGVRAKLR